jgi:sarcosine oxidase
MARPGLVMPPDHEFVVVGAGLLGLATARALAGRGRDVLVLEQAGIGHEGGGSRGSCRIFRLGYDDPGYVTMARRARELWRDLEHESGQRILRPTAHLTFGDGLHAVRDGMQRAGAPCELLPAGAAAARFPGIAIGGPALLEPESCVIAADKALRALAAAGPPVRTGVRITGIDDDGRQVTLRADGGNVLIAGHVIVCAGPWTARLLATAGVTVPSAPTLEQVAYLAPSGDPPPGDPPPGDPPPGDPPPGMPIFICHSAAPMPYGLPVPESPLYKIGLHQSGPAADPDSQDQAVHPALTGRLSRLAARHLPGYDLRPVRTERCIYDNTPDEDFILDRAGRIVVGSGTSGHGFKFGPLLGDWLASLATGEPADLPAARFGLGRFSPRAAAGSGSR